MKAIEIARTMGKQFIAVGTEKRISYSGSADGFKGILENAEVIKVIAPKDEHSATIIYVK